MDRELTIVDSATRDSDPIEEGEETSGKSVFF